MFCMRFKPVTMRHEQLSRRVIKLAASGDSDLEGVWDSKYLLGFSGAMRRHSRVDVLA